MPRTSTVNLSKAPPRPKSLRAIAKPPHDTHALRSSYLEVVRADDRASALLAGALLDNLLMTVIKSRMREMDAKEETDVTNQVFFNPGAPLSSFSAKIRVAYAFDYIDKTSHDRLNVIRSVRNAFAHSPTSLSFKHPLIRKECSKLGKIKWQRWVNRNRMPRSRQMFCSAFMTESLRIVGGDDLADIFLNKKDGSWD